MYSHIRLGSDLMAEDAVLFRPGIEILSPALSTAFTLLYTFNSPTRPSPS